LSEDLVPGTSWLNLVVVLVVDLDGDGNVNPGRRAFDGSTEQPLPTCCRGVVAMLTRMF
jgi:hypothetical protein